MTNMNKKNYEFIPGGICAPAGFTAGGMHCGIRKNKLKKDLALIYSETECDTAAVYTTNKVFGAPITVTRANLADGKSRAAVCNSGIANTCTPDGEQRALEVCAAVAAALGISEKDVIVASTGVIGAPLRTQPIIAALPALAASLGAGEEHSDAAATAIMTTDTRKKEYAVRFALGDKTVSIGAIAKGSGMIRPNMATMLCFITTDADIEASVLQEILSDVVTDTFNMVSVDGDTSTNDMVTVMANGKARNARITEHGADSGVFRAGLLALCGMLAKSIAYDGEGATRLVECRLTGAPDTAGAKKLAMSVINSPLVKTLMFGADANWGRILCALGYAGVEFDPMKVDVRFESKAGSITVCRGGGSVEVEVDEDFAKTILSADEVVIGVELNAGGGSATAWGCDLSYEYVRINGDYRS